MKTFYTFLIERTSIEDAMKVLGLSRGFTKDDLESAWKKQAREFHPDRNPGNKTAELKMKLANDAKDVLSDPRLHGQTADVKAQQAQDQEDRDARRNAYADVAQSTTEKHINLAAFRAHFEKIFGESFTSAGAWSPYDRKWGGHDTWYKATFENAERTTVLYFSVTVSFGDLYTKNYLSNPDAGLTMYIHSDILHNRKKVKLTQQNYRMESEYKVLSDPNILFPAAKLKTQSAKDATRKLSKRDVLLTFEKELGAKINYSGSDIWVYVPVGEFKICFYRTTGFGKGWAAWGINGVYGQKSGKLEQGPVGFFYEQQKSMDFLWNELKDIQREKPSTAQAVNTKLIQLASLYKSQKDDLLEK